MTEDEEFARSFGERPPPSPKPLEAPKKKSKPADEFAYELRNAQAPEFEREYRFARDSRFERDWRFDFVFHPYKLAVEIEGLVVRRIGKQIVTTGRHANIAGFREDCLKYATAIVLGFSVLRFEQSMVRNGDALDYTLRALGAKGWRRDAR